MKNYNNIFSEYPDVVNIDQMMKMLGIGRNKAYSLIRTGDIKTVRIGRKYLIPKVRITEFLLNIK